MVTRCRGPGKEGLGVDRPDALGRVYVFTTGWGEPVHPDTVSSLFPILIKRNNAQNPNTPLPRARLHDLRHIHATTLLLAGVPVHIVAARLGHAGPSITHSPGLRPRDPRSRSLRSRRLRPSDQRVRALLAEVLARSRDCQDKHKGPFQVFPGNGP
ncbi:tyrosine-type recombinase/integrase [Nonomuraea sp. NPDC050680]|uniref:tyrosine-type recombinase/integrase n=1 Tax=Nonomuraea sp. NPDC050680 TaxID=3154630 RepID=UPI0033F79670